MSIILYEAIGWVLRIALIPVILNRCRTPPACMAWLVIIFFHPVIGLLLYVLFGSRRLGQISDRRLADLIRATRDQFAFLSAYEVIFSEESCEAPVAHQLQKISGLPVLAGNDVRFIAVSQMFVDELVKDIEVSHSHVHLLFYIFAPDETGHRVIDALIRASKRGVKCRLLVDALGARAFLNSRKLIKQIRDNGIELAVALPLAPLRRRLARFDLRNHRKLAIIDNTVAYTGSQNIINADYGGRRAGPWFDLMGRLTGPVVAGLQAVFLTDWAIETGQQIKSPDVVAMPQRRGEISAQVIDTSPSSPDDSFRRALITAINAAEKRIITTTPYFVIDEPTLLALILAADRGVDVNVVVPFKSDQRLAELAGRANFLSLLEAGVNIYQYHPGLLHSKTTTVDDSFALIGSANLDLRSFNLDFELSVMLYGHETAASLVEIQSAYIKQSTKVNIDEWRKRNLVTQYSERIVALISPVL